MNRSFVFFSPFRLRCSLSFFSRRCSSSLHVDQRRRLTIKKNSTSVHYPQVTPISISSSPLSPLPIFFEPKAVRRTSSSAFTDRLFRSSSSLRVVSQSDRGHCSFERCAGISFGLDPRLVEIRSMGNADCWSTTRCRTLDVVQ